MSYLSEKLVYGSKVKVSCAYCKRTKVVTARDVREHDKHGRTEWFCDRKCYGLWRSARRAFITVRCTFCGKSKQVPLWYYQQRSRLGKREFYCNRSCTAKGILKDRRRVRRVMVQCSACGKLREVTEAYANRHPERWFCNNRCFHEWRSKKRPKKEIVVKNYGRGGKRRFVYKPDHPRADTAGYVLYSRWLIEEKLGRYLEPWEDVHHKDGDTLNDEIENYEVLRHGVHSSIHGSKQAFFYRKKKEVKKENKEEELPF